MAITRNQIQPPEGSGSGGLMAITRNQIQPPPPPPPPRLPVIEEYFFEGEDARELSELLGMNLTIPDALRRAGEHAKAERYYRFSKKFFATPMA